MIKVEKFCQRQNMDEKLCLKWNDFQENIGTSFENLRQAANFSDVTLVSDDGEQIECHKVILAASSPFFEKLLKRGDHPRPLIFLRGVKKADLDAVIDFLYCGEANILQENLESFLAIAEDLQVKGLQLDKGLPGQRYERKEMPTKIDDSKPLIKNKENDGKKSKDIKHEPTENPKTVDGGNTSLVSDPLQIHKEKVRSLMIKSEKHISNESYNLRAYSCTVCGKEGVKTNIERHIEVHHVERVAFNCPVCDKSLKSSAGLAQHKSAAHTSLLK